jgi:hypothetical protein
MGPLDLGMLLSPAELSHRLNERGLGAFPADAILQTVAAGQLEVRADAGRGKQNRVIPLVEWGADCIGLNTEANCREILGRTFRESRFATRYEFIDSSEAARSVALDGDPFSGVCTAPNQRDLLAIRDDAEQRIVWAVETKGHSGLESWDFWELFGQLSRLEAWASTVRQEASSTGRAILVNVAIAIPERRCQGSLSCYARELARLRSYLDQAHTIPGIAQKTQAHFVDWWTRWSGPQAGNRGPTMLLVRGIGDVQGTGLSRS